jgi:hypothetical protein
MKNPKRIEGATMLAVKRAHKISAGVKEIIRNSPLKGGN